jgi:hypothetical protein
MIWYTVFRIAIFCGIFLTILCCVIALIKRKTGAVFCCSLILLLLIIYGDITGERFSIVRSIGPSIMGPTNAVWLFKREHHRYPYSVEELKADVVIDSMLRRASYGAAEYDHVISRMLFCSPLRIVKKPEFGIKTYIEGTLVHCVLYSYGFDYDDDSLKHIAFDYHESMLPNPSAGLWYILSPVPLDGDIIVGHLGDYIDSPRWPEGFIDSVLTLQNRIW